MKKKEAELVSCPASVLTGLVMQLSSKKAWKGYVSGATSDASFVNVSYFEVEGKKHLIVAVSQFGEHHEIEDAWMEEVLETMKLWKAEFNGVATLYSGRLNGQDV